MIDSDGLLLDPIYSVQGIAATLVLGGASLDVTVIDRTAGMEIQQGPLDLPVTRPAAMIRRAELDAAGIAVPDVKGGALTFRGKTWEIANYERKPVPGGSGQVLLILNDGDA